MAANAGSQTSKPNRKNPITVGDRENRAVRDRDAQWPGRTPEGLRSASRVGEHVSERGIVGVSGRDGSGASLFLSASQHGDGCERIVHESAR
jgi:hypothetical protein